jgi:hypothetical protein
LIGFGSAPDPFIMTEYVTGFTSGYYVLTGKNLQTSTLTSTNIKTVITGGQSNMATAPSSITYATVNSLAWNMNPYDGGFYNGSDANLGCSNTTNVGVSSMNMRFADSVITSSKATQCIMVPIALAGTPYAIWTPNASGSIFNRIKTAVLRCRARGLEPDAFVWGEGEQDNILGTASSAVTDSIQQIVVGIRAIPCTAPFYVGLYTMAGGTTSSAVRAGITASVSSSLNIVLGFDADTNCPVAGGFRLADNTHLSNLGLNTASTNWRTIVFP